MQRELAASGLSDEEILAKTLLLQKVNLSYFQFVRSTFWNPRICIILNTYSIVNALTWVTRITIFDIVHDFQLGYLFIIKAMAGDNSPAFINKTLRNALNVANLSPEDLAQVWFLPATGSEGTSNLSPF